MTGVNRMTWEVEILPVTFGPPEDFDYARQEYGRQAVTIGRDILTMALGNLLVRPLYTLGTESADIVVNTIVGCFGEVSNT